MLTATAPPSVLNSVTSDTDSTARLVTENRGVGTDGKAADGSELITRTAALATRTMSYATQAASVELWTASVGGVAGKDETQRPQVAFLRMTVDLVRAAETLLGALLARRIEGSRSRPGPSSAAEDAARAARLLRRAEHLGPDHLTCSLSNALTIPQAQPLS